MALNDLVVLCAWVLDAVLGDPESMPHPVRIMGRLIKVLESKARAFFKNKKTAGVLLGFSVPLIVFIATLLLVESAAAVSPFVGALASMVIIYTGLSTRCLGDEALAILKMLRKGDIAASRKCLARIVGRDTEGLARDGVVCATVESVSENTVDGIIAPLFYAFIGGAPLMMAYKAVNTLDSMVGYRNAKYREIGWFSARLDDAANFIPARLSLVVIPIAASILYPARALKIFKSGLRDRKNSPSPNAGFPEACFAAALGIQLGGRCSYHGVVSQKPFLGDRERENEAEDIVRAVRLMWLSSAFALAFFSATAVILRRWAL